MQLQCQPESLENQSADFSLATGLPCKLSNGGGNNGRRKKPVSIKPGLEGKAAEDAFGFFLTTGFLGHEIIPSSFKHLTEVSKLRAPWVLFCFVFLFQPISIHTRG